MELYVGISVLLVGFMFIWPLLKSSHGIKVVHAGITKIHQISSYALHLPLTNLNPAYDNPMKYLLAAIIKPTLEQSTIHVLSHCW